MAKPLFPVSLAAALAIASFGFAGNADARKPQQDTFFHQTIQATGSLSSQLQRRGVSNKPLLVTAAHNLDDLGQSESVGRLVGELVASTLAEGGWAVQEVRLRDELVINFEGELMLSRDLHKLTGAYDADTAIISTYSKAGQRLYITIKAVRLSDGVIMASHSFETKMPGRM